MTASPRSRVGLSALLIAVNVGLVAAVLMVVVGQAGRLLRQLGDAQALGRVSLAGASALRAITDTEHEVLTTTRLLAERPTLVELVRTGDRAALLRFLQQFQETSQLTACAILGPGGPIGAAGPGRDWEALWRSVTNGTDSSGTTTFGDRSTTTFIIQPSGEESFVVGAAVPLQGHSDVLVLATRALDQAYLEDLGNRIGSPAAITGPAGFDADTRGALRERAVTTGSTVLHRFEEEDAYVAILPIGMSRESGVLQVTLSGAGVAAAMAELRRSLILLALFVAAAAAAASILLGHRLVGPLRDLTAAAARIGRGDLETPIQRSSGAEIATLGTTMEDMRRRLVDLTAELRRRRAEAETLLNGVLDGVFTVDRDRKIRYVNPQGAALAGLRSDEILGRFCGDVLDPEPVNGVRPCEDRCPILHARFRGTVRATEQLRFRKGTRQRTVVITSARPETNPEDSPEILQFQMIRDETEVEATRRLRDLVVANITHEFRTPLSAQRASIELLRDRMDQLAPSADVQSLMASLELGTLRLTWLIDNLLESARLEAGRMTIRRQPVALDQVIEEAASMTAPLLAQRGQLLETELPFPLSQVHGDAARLTQVFVNLLANANKFAPPGTSIRIGGATSASEVNLWVEDAGPGFPQQDSSMLFERFVRSPGEEPEESGMGLGLWIVRSIVERHGGRVEAGSGADQKGARITITLPLTQVDT